MRRPFPTLVLPSATLGALLLVTACAATSQTPAPVALPLTAPAATEIALDGHASGGELADARLALAALEDNPATTAHRPDLVAVAREGFACWEGSALTEAPLTTEAAACRTDFWGAVHALSAASSIAEAR